MKKISLLSMVALSAAILLSACGGSSTAKSTETEAGQTSPPVKLIAAHVNTEDSSFHAGMLAFKEKLEKLSGGNITVEIHPNGELGGNENELVEKMATGTVDVIVAAPNFLASSVKEADLFSIPYLYEDSAHWQKVVSGEVGDAISAKVEAGNQFKVLGYWSCGVREYFGIKPITKVDDLKGVKIRVQDSEMLQSVWSSLGAQPTVLAYNELYSGLQNHVIDAAENDLGNILLQKFYEAAPYISMTDHDIATRFFLISAEKYNTLTDEQKGWVDEAGKECCPEEWAFDTDLCDKAKVEIEKNGGIFNDVDTKEFADKSYDARLASADKLGVKDLFEKITAMRTK